MENGEVESPDKPVSAFDAMRKRFEQQAENNTSVKPSVKTKPVVGKFGGGGELNICAPKKTAEGSEQRPGLNKPGNIANRPEPVSPTDTSPNTQDEPLKKRNSSVSIPPVFMQNHDSAVPPVKPKPKVEPRSKSDANNNADQSGAVSTVSEKPMYGGIGPNTKFGPLKKGNTSPRDGPQTIANPIQGLSPGDLKKNLRHVEVKKLNTTDTPKTDPTTTGRESLSAVELRKKYEELDARVKNQRKFVKSFIRTGDNKKFRKEENKFENSGEAPTKPEKIDVNLDIENLIEEFKKQVQSYGSDTREEGIKELDEEEECDDVGNIQRKESRVVSMIQPMTEEDELDEEWRKAGFHGLDNNGENLSPQPDELYDEGISTSQNKHSIFFLQTQEPEMDETYEPLPDDEPGSAPPIAPRSQQNSSEPPPVPELKTARKTSEAESKESEKERKRREKEEKERKEREEKAQKKKEKELKALLNTYSISAEELIKSQGKGKIKRTAKASNKKCLAVQEGDTVDIIRMENKGAKGKWLVRLDITEKVGYVEADNIEVDTTMIRSIMQNKGDNAAKVAPEDDQEMYEAVDGADEGMNGYEEDEIYEECN